MPLYLNTDLKLRSKNDLATVTTTLGESVFVMNESEGDDGFFFSFELSTELKNANLALEAWCDLLEASVDQMRDAWDGCSSRTLDIGIESDADGAPSATQISPELNKRLIDLGITLGFTVYPVPDPTEISANPVEPT